MHFFVFFFLFVKSDFFMRDIFYVQEILKHFILKLTIKMGQEILEV